MRRTYKYRCYLTLTQRTMLESWLSWAASLYNAFLQDRRDTYLLAEREVHRRRPWHPLDGPQRPAAVRHWDTDKQEYVRIPAPKGIGFVEQSASIKGLKPAGVELPEGMPVQALHEVARRVDRAFKAFFRRANAGQKAGYPRFRSGRRYHSLTLTLSHENHKVDPETGEIKKTLTSGSGRCENGRLTLSGLGEIKVRWHRPIPSEAVAKTCTILRSCGRWYVCISLELPDVELRPDDGRRPIGVDMGIWNWATLSNGETFNPPAPGRHKSARRRGGPKRRPRTDVARIHARTVSRRHKQSKRRQKTVRLLAQAREEERNRRTDWRHKFAHEITERFSVIVVEDLGEVDMMRSEVGTVEEPNPQAFLKRRHNRRIADQAWHLAHLALEYKAEEAGVRFVRVPSKNTTRRCSQCGGLVPKPVTDRVYSCPSCGYKVARAYNSARNIEQDGLAKLAATDRGGPRPSGGNGRGVPHAVA